MQHELAHELDAFFERFGWDPTWLLESDQPWLLSEFSSNEVSHYRYIHQLHVRHNMTTQAAHNAQSPAAIAQIVDRILTYISNELLDPPLARRLLHAQLSSPGSYM